MSNSPSENQKQRLPVPPYLAIGLSTTCRGIGKRSDIMRNINHIENMIHGAMFVVSINMPVKIIALAEGALSGFTDEAFDIPHVTAARDLWIDIPGPETDRLGEIAKQYETYIIGQCKARLPEVIKDRFFNMAFVIDPKGNVVHKYAKNHVFARERSCMPHDVYDIWVEKFGDGIDAFYPVLKTEDIGNIGTMICNDGMYPEPARALAFNGAEVIYRPSMAQPITGNGQWETQNKSHAMFNNCYVIAPNVGPYYLHPGFEHGFDVAGGNSHIVDYQGNIISFSASGTDTVTAAIIDIEQLRHFREMSLFGNGMKDLRTEIFKRMYEKPIHPKNMWIDQDPLQHADHDEIFRGNIKRLQEMGAYTPPASHYPGSKFIPSARDHQMRIWENARKALWGDDKPSEE